MSFRPRHVLLAIGGVIFLALSAGMYFAPGFILTPLASFGPPLRAGSRVYLLTGQWKKALNFHR